MVDYFYDNNVQRCVTLLFISQTKVADAMAAQIAASQGTAFTVKVITEGLCE